MVHFNSWTGGMSETHLEDCSAVMLASWDDFDGMRKDDSKQRAAGENFREGGPATSR